MSARGLHKLAGAAHRARLNAVSGEAVCTLCPDRSVAYTEAIGGRGGLIKPMCERHAQQGERLGYSVHRGPLTDDEGKAQQ